jgi:2,3-dihydroxyphenylpropionate 1,2-dioxygenase
VTSGVRLCNANGSVRLGGYMPEYGLVGGAALPHAPQFFSLPPTEDREQVSRIEELMGDIGQRLRGLEPDVVVIAANDHLENFAMHCVPSFTVHCGPSAHGSFAGRDFRWPIEPRIAMSLVHGLQDAGFDPAFTLTPTIGYEFGIPLTFCGFHDTFPIIPVYVNTYVAPQPSAERCYSFGRALHQILAARGVRGVVIASGGLSHFPGTDRYASPDLDTDEYLVARLRQGNLRALVALDNIAMDRTGNVEIRSWQILAGALGERSPDIVSLEPSWHHNYAIFGWTTQQDGRGAELHYPPFRADRVELTRALYELRTNEGARGAFLADRARYAGSFGLDEQERQALVDLDEDSLRRLGVHPLLAFLARLEVELEGRKSPSAKLRSKS